MSKMQSTNQDKEPEIATKSPVSAIAAQVMDIEDDRDRAIAKAALTISEICERWYNTHQVSKLTYRSCFA